MPRNDAPWLHDFGVYFQNTSLLIEINAIRNGDANFMD